MDLASFLLSLCAFLTASAALFIAYLQLREARTATGGRGMILRFRPIQRDELDDEEAQLIDDSISDLAARNPDIKMTAILLTAEVHGPAAFYELGPYTWGEEGAPDTPLGFAPIKKFTCESGPASFVVMVQTELLRKVKIGVVWIQPWDRGLQTGAIRTTLDGELEEWTFYSRLQKIFAKKGVTGYWRARKSQQEEFGPVSQPWQHPRSRTRKRPR